MNGITRTAARRLALPLLLTAALGAPAAAQLPSASAGALGMGDNYTALARGFDAVAWNPAMLGLAGGPVSSFTILSLRGVEGLGPVTLSDLNRHQGKILPVSVREEWLRRITAEGSESGSAGSELTLMAANALRVGVQISTQLHGTADLGPGGAQLLLFGNAGRTGQAEDLDLTGSSFHAAATSTVAISYGQPLSQDADGNGLSLGVTAKYTLGNILASGVDAGGRVTADPLGLDLRFPIIHTDTIVDVGHLNNGGGWGMDLGLAWQESRWVAGAVLKNVVNTFEWDHSKLFYRNGVARIDVDSSSTDFNARPFESAPKEVLDRVRELGFHPSLAAGVAFRRDERLLLSADVHQRFRTSKFGEPTNHVGVGAEFRPLLWLPLRAGVARLSGGHLLSTGLGVEMGAIAFNASVASRGSSLGANTIGMFTFTAGVGRPKR